MQMFSSVNPYESLEVVIADSPQELVQLLKTITTPIKIIAITPSGSRHAAYIMGDVRIVQSEKKPNPKGDKK
jgi:hypothetical protein